MATRIKVVDANNPDPQLLRRAAALILLGEVVVCPTDTGYALAANALDPNAIRKVFVLKGRSYLNPIHVAVSSMGEAEKYACVNEAAECLARNFLPGALTLVMTKKEIIPSLLVGGRDTVGIRIPDNRVILDLAAMTDVPLTATSANASGSPTAYTIQEIEDQTGEILKQAALVLDQGALYPRDISTIVDLTTTPPHVIREGRVTCEELRKVLPSLEL
jgi:L-threonylcarbamoyladenylate synthase